MRANDFDAPKPQDDRARYEQGARDVIKGADPDHIARVRKLDPELLRKHVSYAWDRVNSGEYKLNRPNLEENNKDIYNQVYQLMIKQKPEFMLHAPSADVKKAIIKAMGFGSNISVNDLATYAYGLLKSNDLEENDPIEEDLRKWFKEKWVRFGPDGKIRGDCARGSEGEGKPKCLPQSKAHALGKKGRASAAARKRRQDPNPERQGAAINVATKRKSNEDTAGAQLDEKCWDTHRQVGMKKKGDRIVPNCVPRESVNETQQCPHCGGPMFNNLLLAEKKDACYNKVRSRYKVWPSAYASGALVQCRKKGAANWGNKSKNEDVAEVKGELWRVMMPRGQGGHSERYYVVKGYGKDLELWRSKSGAGDFVKRADAEAKADELNKGVAEGIDRRGFLKGLAGFAAGAAVPAPVVKMLSTPAGVASMPIAAGIALLKGIEHHLDQWDAEDDDDFHDAWEDLAGELGFDRTEPLSNLLDLQRRDPERAAAELIKHIQSRAIDPADVKSSLSTRADNPSDWRYQNKIKSAGSQGAGTTGIARLAGLAKTVSNNASSLPAPGKVTPALSAPTKPEFDLSPDLKQKQKVPANRKDMTEGLDDDESVLYHFAEVLADELGYDADEVADSIVSEMTTPSGIEVYSFTDDDQTYYMGVLRRGKGSAIVSVSHAGGGQDNELEIYGPGENLKYVVKYGRTTPTLHTPDNKAIAQAAPGHDENYLVGVALDMLWGRMQQRYTAEDISQPTFEISSYDNFATAFEVEMIIDNNNAGFFSYQYFPETNDVENDVDIHSAQYRGQGYGKMLLLKAIETAQEHNLPFKVDRNGVTPAQGNVYRSLLADRIIRMNPDKTIIATGRSLPAPQDMAQDQLQELSPDLLKRASQAAGQKYSQAADYGNKLSDTDAQALMKHYNQQRDKFSQGANTAQQRIDRRATMQKISPSAAALRKTGVSQDQLDEINWRKGLATAAMAAGAVGAMSSPAQARVMTGPDGQTTPSFAQQMKPSAPASSASSARMPNQDLQTVDNVTKVSNDNFVITHNNKEYQAKIIPIDFKMIPRGGVKVKVAQAQMGERGIGSYVAYLLPNGTAIVLSGPPAEPTNEANGDDVWGPQGRFAGDVPANIGSGSMNAVVFNIGDKVIVKHTGEVAMIDNLTRDKKLARVTVPSKFGGKTFDIAVADLKPYARGDLREHVAKPRSAIAAAIYSVKR